MDTSFLCISGPVCSCIILLIAGGVSIPWTGIHGLYRPLTSKLCMHEQTHVPHRCTIHEVQVTGHHAISVSCHRLLARAHIVMSLTHYVWSENVESWKSGLTLI